MASSMWLIVCICSLVVMLSISLRWFLLRRALLIANNPVRLDTPEERRQQVFSVHPYSSANLQRHGIGGLGPSQSDRCPVILQMPSGVAYNPNSSTGQSGRTVQHTGRISGPPSYEQAMTASAQNSTQPPRAAGF